MVPAFFSSPPERFEADGIGFGIGAQVGVQDASITDHSRWPANPSGLIVRTGGSAVSSVWGRSGGGRAWLVEFDEPQTDIDGAGPFASAQILEKYLELAPPIVDLENVTTARQ